MKHSLETAVTAQDVTGIPTNPMHERIEAVAAPDDMRVLNLLRAEHQAAIGAVRNIRTGVLNGNLDDSIRSAREAWVKYDIAIWDMTKKYPKAEPQRSRDQIDISLPRMGSVCIIVANSVNLGLRSVLASARYGMTGTVMQERDIDDMDRKLSTYARKIQNAHPIYREACVLTPDHDVSDYWHLISRYENNTAIVVDGDRDEFHRDEKILGIVGPKEIRRAKGRNSVAIRRIFKPMADVVHAKPGIQPREIVKLLDATGQDFLPIVDNDHVKGVTSKSSAGYHLRFSPHMDKAHNRLAYLVGLRHDWKNMDKIKEWIEQGKVGRGFKIDRAHLDRGTDPFRFIEAVRKLVDAIDPSLEVHAGNIATGEGALRAARAGATGVWVGVGPSPVCLTRVMTNYGIPQVTAMENVTEQLEDHGYKDVLRLGDGGTLDEPGYAVAVLRAGAHGLAGSTSPSKTRESSQRIENFEDSDKTKRRIWVSGNAAEAAQFDGEPQEKENDEQIFRRTQKPRKEGDTRKVAMNPEFETTHQFGHYTTNGITSGISFGGADTIPELHAYGRAMQQTTSGVMEGKSRLG